MQYIYLEKKEMPIYNKKILFYFFNKKEKIYRL